jgi:hypothetical protein
LQVNLGPENADAIDVRSDFADVSHGSPPTNSSITFSHADCDRGESGHR